MSHGHLQLPCQKSNSKFVCPSTLLTALTTGFPISVNPYPIFPHQRWVPSVTDVLWDSPLHTLLLISNGLRSFGEVNKNCSAIGRSGCKGCKGCKLNPSSMTHGNWFPSINSPAPQDFGWDNSKVFVLSYFQRFLYDIHSIIDFIKHSLSATFPPYNFLTVLPIVPVLLK